MSFTRQNINFTYAQTELLINVIISVLAELPNQDELDALQSTYRSELTIENKPEQYEHHKEFVRKLNRILSTLGSSDREVCLDTSLDYEQISYNITNVFISIALSWENAEQSEGKVTVYNFSLVKPRHMDM